MSVRRRDKTADVMSGAQHMRGTCHPLLLVVLAKRNRILPTNYQANAAKL
jgi:hypothetical protein